MTPSKIGFHSGPVGNMNGIGEFWKALSQAKIPIFHKSADSYGPLYEIIDRWWPAGMEHHLVYRMSTRGQNDGYDYDVPPYHLSVQEAAAVHWQRTRDNLPDEFSRERVWIEPINEIDKNRADWLGHFAVNTAKLANAEGYKVTLFGWSSGEPEPAHWQTPGMLAYLRYCAAHPTQAAVSVHEYNFHHQPFAEVHPHHIGRFLNIHATCDAHNIPCPTIHITEWGWSLNSVPTWANAEPFITACNELYAKYPNVKGAAIWNLGKGPEFGDIHNQTQKFIAPLTTYTLTHSFEGTPSPTPCRGQPRAQYARTCWVVPASATEAQRLELYRQAAVAQKTIGPSFDDAGLGDLSDKTAVIYGISPLQQPVYVDWYKAHYPGTKLQFEPLPGGDQFPSSSAITPAPTTSGCKGLPRVQYARVYWVVANATEAQWLELYRQAALAQKTIGPSYDDAGLGDLSDKTAVLYGVPLNERPAFLDWYANHYPGTKVQFEALPEAAFAFTHWPTEYATFTQKFGANPVYYGQFGLPGHEGLDIKAPTGSKIFAVADGVVSNRRDEADGHNYGRFIRVRHSHGYETTYAHLERIAEGLAVGTAVKGGRVLGTADNTGNSTGSHLHLTCKHDGAVPGGSTYIGYPHNIVDPTPLMARPPGTPTPPPPTGNALFGVHASADSRNLTDDATKFAAAKAHVVKVLSSHAPGDVVKLRQATGANHWVIRAFLDFGGRVVSPGQFVEWTLGDVRRTVEHLRGTGVADANMWIELHNEPNLTTEGLDTSWGNGSEFASWFMSVLQAYRAAFPNLKYLYPGLSPGPNLVWSNGRRLGHRFFWSDNAVNAADGLAIHSYWSPGYPMQSHPDAGFALVSEAIARWPNKPIWITEASNNSGSVGQLQKAQEYIDFWKWLRTKPTVRGVTYFVMSASNPAWGWQGGSGEVWTVAMASAVGGRQV